MSEKVKVYEIGIDELLPDPRNANKGSVRGQKMIDDSVGATGLHRGVSVDMNGYLVAGNKTQQAAIDAGFKKALVVETDGDTLVVTKRRDFDLMSDDPNNIARKAAFYDNRTSETSLTWDAEVLLADLQSGVDLSGLFDKAELDALLAGLVTPEPADDPNEHWQGMPEFAMEDKTSFRSIHVHFKEQADVDAFAILIGQKLGDNTRSVWYPEADKIDMYSELYVDES